MRWRHTREFERGNTMSHRVTLKALLALVPALILPQYGCVSRRLAPTILSYNLAVEKAQNEMLLLNVLRAAKHQPMYLTDLSKITGSIKRDLTASLSHPFGSLHRGPGANEVATPGMTYSVNPTFDVNILNTQDFIRGFLAPVSPDEFAYYWAQDYPPNLLLHLFVLRVDIKSTDIKGNTTITTYSNHPREENKNNDLRCFGQWVSWFTSAQARPWLVGVDAKGGQIGPALELDNIDIVAAAKEALDVDEINSGGKKLYQLKRSKQEYRLKSAPVGLFEPHDCTPSEGLVADRLKESVATNLRGEIVDSKDEIIFHLRSTEGIIYYLGQILRLEHFNGTVPWIKIDHKLLPIFVGLPKDEHEEPSDVRLNCDAFVDVTDSEGDRYIIPRSFLPKAPDSGPHDANVDPLEYSLEKLKDCTPGMSLTTLNVVSQLIGLHKASKDFPTTPLVRAIGQ
jgi:hypothetical protein